MDVAILKGSLLGPRIFALFVNDLPANEKAGNIQIFADYTTIYYIGKEAETIVDASISILVELYKWCQRIHLIMHESKMTPILIPGTPFIGPMRNTK